MAMSNLERGASYTGYRVVPVRLRGAILVLTLLGAVAASACGLLSKGPTQEEYDALVGQVETANLQLEVALNDAQAAGKVKSELVTTKSQLEEAQKQLADLQPDLERLKQIDELATSNFLPLEKARLVAIRNAQENKPVYPPHLVNSPLVWEVASESEGEEYYYITLSYRPAGNFKGTTGLEEFILDKAGKIEFRQVLTEPEEGAVEPTTTPEPKPKE